MLERDDIHFFDTSALTPTPGIAQRATERFVRDALEASFPGEAFPSVKVSFNDTGVYKQKASLLERLFGAGKPIEGLPPYYEVEVIHATGDFTETLIVWSPLAWNDRFAGTAGGGTGIGGRNYLTKPSNTQRGWTVPFAVLNGFTAATMYAGNIEGRNDHTVDPETGAFRPELYENWRLRSTHHMTVFGKAIAEILHDRPVRWAYLNGGSGGGRQSLMEVQYYPQDYHGVWASCPGINWHSFLMADYWALVVMNERGHFLSRKKNAYLENAVHQAYGGTARYYQLSIDEMDRLPAFDAKTCIGQKVGRSVITAEDAEVMNEIWRGPHRRDGSFLWYGFRPGVRNWNHIIPIGTYYYPLLGRRVKPFMLGPIYLRWITGDLKRNYDNMKWDEYVELFDRGMEKFSDNLGDDARIDAFVEAGGKLMIDHGIDDPLIPVDGTMDYARKLRAHFGSQKKLDTFLRLYINPGDNHGNCWGKGPGITEKAGMLALMQWVEQGVAPEGLRKVRCSSRDGSLLEEGTAQPYRFAEGTHEAL